MAKLTFPFDLVLSFPQWQGSGRHHHLQRGALALAEMLEANAPIERVPLSTLEGTIPGINRFDALLMQMISAQQILQDRHPDRVLTAGGDCAVDIAIIDYLVGRYPDLTVIWIDSHFDANTPEVSPSGNLHGMPVAALMGAAPPAMQARLHHQLEPARFRYVWANIGDEGERAFQRKQGLLWLDDKEQVTGPIHIHLDLDVLDQTEFPYVAYPEENGMEVMEAVALLHRLQSAADVVGFSVTEFAPATEEDARRGTATIATLLNAMLPDRSMLT